jgi:uncharacterized protein YutE (UPF0331/DUF86 family)
MINYEVIKERLKEIEENVEILAELGNLNRDKFKSDPKIYKLAEHCHYMIATNNWTRPKDNKESIDIVARHKIIPSSFAKRIRPLAGLRNLIIHEYFAIDLDRIFKHIQNIEDFRQFQKYILAYLSKHHS